MTMNTELIEVTADTGETFTLRVPTDPFHTIFGTLITEEHRALMSKALDKAMGGRYWKSSFRVVVPDYQDAKVLAEAAHFFHGCDPKFEMNAEGTAYIVASIGYQG